MDGWLSGDSMTVSLQADNNEVKEASQTQYYMLDYLYCALDVEKVRKKVMNISLGRGFL